MNCCTSRCGYCGRCDDGVSNRPEPYAPTACDLCGIPLYGGHLTLQGVGTACSRQHMDALVRRHEQLMNRRSA